MRFAFSCGIASPAGAAFALLLLSMPSTVAFGAAGCEQVSGPSASQIRRTRASQNSMNRSTAAEDCHVVIAQFIEAVTARQAAASCQDDVSRERALKVLDVEIQTFNNRIAEQSCSP